MVENKKLIAIVGMPGAGKTQATNYLLKKLNCPKVYFGEPTFDRLKKENLEVNYLNERKIREKIRSELGMGAYAILSVPKIKKLLKDNSTIILESLYSWDEYKIIKSKYKNQFKVIAIYASPEVRYKRLRNRTEERPIKSINGFDARNYSEIEGTDKGGPIAMSDFTIVNEYSLKKFRLELNKIINQL